MTRLDILNNFVDCMETHRKKLGLTQKQMASKLDISESGYRKIVRKEVMSIDLYTAYLLHKLTNLWFYEMLGISNKQIDSMKRLNHLTREQQNYITQIIEFESDFYKEIDYNSNDVVPVIVPTGNMADGMIYDSSNIEHVNIHNYREKYGARIACGIKINSNHFHPVYHLNDILLICCEPIRDGDIGVFINKENGCAYLRKLVYSYPCKLEPINNYGTTIYVDSHDEEQMSKWIKFGYVLTKMRHDICK